MLCLGRPLDSRGNPQIRAEIPKLDQKHVNMIPLVVFIPEEDSTVEEEKQEEHTYPPQTPSQNEPSASSDATQVTTPAPAGETSAPKAKKPRFRFLRRKTKPVVDTPTEQKQVEKGAETKGEKAEEDPWEARFERNEHPFVKLDGNRATCAICLCDFVAPRPRGTVEPGPSSTPGPSHSALPALAPPSAEASQRSSLVVPSDQEGPDGKEKEKRRSKTIKKTKKEKEEKEKVEEDDGVGVPGEPLRLLACGHVFHKQCLDPWLLDVSGRCPVCQRKVLEDDADGNMENP